MRSQLVAGSFLAIVGRPTNQLQYNYSLAQFFMYIAGKHFLTPKN